MNAPQWTAEGQPANDEAAIADALEWLDLMRSVLVHIVKPAAYERNTARLDRCIAELRKRLPAEEDAS